MLYYKELSSVIANVKFLPQVTDDTFMSLRESTKQGAPAHSLFFESG